MYKAITIVVAILMAVIILILVIASLKEQEKDIKFLTSQSELRTAEMEELADTFRDYINEQNTKDIERQIASSDSRDNERTNILYGMVGENSSEIDTLRSEVDTLKTEVTELRKLVTQLKK